MFLGVLMNLGGVCFIYEWRFCEIFGEYVICFVYVFVDDFVE